MLTYNKDDFDGTLDDIMKSVNDILNKTGKKSIQIFCF